MTLCHCGGYTFGMKIAVSIPDDVFENAERLASRLNSSRSQLYARALAEFVARHDENQITSAMNQVIEQIDSEKDEFLKEAAKQSFRRTEW